MSFAFRTGGLPPAALSRRGLIGLGAAGLLFAASGCSSSGGSGASAGPVALDVSLWGDAKRAELYQAALDLFVTQQTDLTATLQFADLNPYLERLATSAAARDLPDVFWMRDTHIGRYGSAGSLLDLKPYLGDAIDVTGIGEEAVADGTVDGGVFALPTHYVGQAVLSDTNRLDSIGADITSVATWDDLASLAAEAADPGAGYYGIGDPTTGVTHRHLEAWIRQAGEELFDEDGGVGFTADTVESWYEYWQQLRDAELLPAADVQIESESSGWPTDLIVTGKTALRLASTNHLTLVQGLTTNPIGLSSVPADANATDDWWFFPPILISVAANAASPDVAAAMVDFFVNDLDAAAITKLSQGAPSSAAVRDSILADLTKQEAAFVSQISREQELPRRPFPIRPEGAEAFNTSITRAGQEIAYGRQSITSAVATLLADGKQNLGSK